MGSPVRRSPSRGGDRRDHGRGDGDAGVGEAAPVVAGSNTHGSAGSRLSLVAGCRRDLDGHRGRSQRRQGDLGRRRRRGWRLTANGSPARPRWEALTPGAAGSPSCRTACQRERPLPGGATCPGAVPEVIPLCRSGDRVVSDALPRIAPVGWGSKAPPPSPLREPGAAMAPRSPRDARRGHGVDAGRVSATRPQGRRRHSGLPRERARGSRDRGCRGVTVVRCPEHARPRRARSRPWRDVLPTTTTVRQTATSWPPTSQPDEASSCSASTGPYGRAGLAVAYSEHDLIAELADAGPCTA